MSGREQLTYDGTKNKTFLLPCVKCAVETHHVVLASVDYLYDDENLTYWADYQVVQCPGCRSISFRQASRSTEDYDYDPATGDGEPVDAQKLYPARVAGRRELEQKQYLPSHVRRVYEETCLAVVNSQPVLAGVGIRAIVEAVCRDKKASGSNLEAKIDDLVAKGVLTAEGAEILHSTRLMGNEAAHEVKAHSVEELNTAMSVVEHLLTGTYVLPREAKRLPSRAKQKKGGGQ